MAARVSLALAINNPAVESQRLCQRRDGDGMRPHEPDEVGNAPPRETCLAEAVAMPHRVASDERKDDSWSVPLEAATPVAQFCSASESPAASLGLGRK